MDPLNPTKEQLDARLAASGLSSPQQANVQAGLSAPPTYSPTSLNSPTPVKVPTVPIATSPEALNAITSNSATSLTSIIDQLNKPSESEGTQNALQSEFMKTLESLSGKQERTLQLENQAKLPEQLKQLQTISGQVQGINAEAQAEIIKAESMGDTLGFARGEQGAIERQRAIRVLPLVAQAQALQGNIALAQSNIDRAVQLEFEPQERRLDYLKQAYAFNQDNLSREDKKRAERLNLLIGERERILAEEKTNREGVLGIMTGVAKYGAPQNVINSISKARTVEEAVRLAGPYMQDPRAKVELQNAILDTQLKKSQIKKAQYEFELLQKYGGMTPAQYADYQKEQNKKIADEKDAAKKAQMQGGSLNEKVTLLDSVLRSSAIDSVVGPTILTRASSGGRFTRGVLGAGAGAAAGSVIPGVGTAIGAIAGGIGGLLLGAKDAFAGASDKLIGQTEQFISKEFLQSLIDTKAQGGTFGALTKPEQEALTAAATYIGGRRVYSGKGEDKQVIGYDMAEADFRRELEMIQSLTKKAYQQATGSTFSPDEQRFFDSWNTLDQQTTFNPAF